MKMYLISEDEMLALEKARCELAEKYLMTTGYPRNVLWVIINRRRSLKWALNKLFSKVQKY